jgi:peptidoglycan/LPS O-acetylase OafA/YrhL
LVLRAQGLNEAADRFAYRAQVLRRRVLRRGGTRAYGPYLFSWLLDVLAGYGYKPGRTLWTGLFGLPVPPQKLATQ